jgi:signal transduction histidine kinase/DNA-binding response OmpR family regulator
VVVSTYAGDGIARYAGDGGDRRKASLVSPGHLVVRADGAVCYVDMGNERGGRVRCVDGGTGLIETVVGGGTEPADGVPAHRAALDNRAQGLALDSRGNLFIGSERGGVVFRVDARSGLIRPFAGAGDSTLDGIPASNLSLSKPITLRVGSSDTLFIADAGLHAVFKVDGRTGRVSRLAGIPGRSGQTGDDGPANAALLDWPTDVALDPLGNVYITDRNNHVIRRIDATTGTISRFAGTTGAPGFSGDGGDRLSAQFQYPQGLLLDRGRLLVADRLNNRIRAIDLASGIVSTLAGSGSTIHGGENVPALEAGIYDPVFMLRKDDGNLLVAAVRARRIYAVGGPVRLLVPWWRSWWAIGSYVGSFLLLIFGVVQMRTRALRRQTSVLEGAVALRTRELNEQKSLYAQQAAQLHELIERKDRLMARLSHEFRTPLTVILGPIERLQASAASETLRDNLAATRRSSGRLLRLVEHLLGLVKLAHGHTGPTGPVRAAPIVRRVVASFESRATEQDVDLTASTVEDVILQSTAEAIEVIAANLVSNAVKYTPPGGRVQVSLRSAAGAAVLEVADDGSGISPDRLARIFEPFGEDSRPFDQQAATGLGLALVKQLATSHGGSVEAESQQGRGSVFRAMLPLAEDRVAEPVPLPTEPASAHSGNAWPTETTVLLIEDDADMREYLREVVAAHHRCLVATDGQMGLEVARQEIPDLVVCDVLLPAEDGLSVCRALKDDEPTSHIPVILLTALETGDQRLRGLEAGADDYIIKPFDEGELVSRIANLLEVRSLLQQRFGRDLRWDRTGVEDLGVRDQEFLARLAGIADARHSDASLGVAELAKTLSMSDRQLQRKIRALVGVTPAEYLRSVRLRHALDRLRAGERPSDVALAVGFESHAYFATCFKAHFGFAPSGARRQLASEDNATGVNSAAAR